MAAMQDKFAPCHTGRVFTFWGDLFKPKLF